MCLCVLMKTSKVGDLPLAETFGALIHHDTIRVKFDGQGHGSKFKVKGGNCSFMTTDARYEVMYLHSESLEGSTEHAQKKWTRKPSLNNVYSTKTTRWRYCVECTQDGIRSERSAISAQAVHFLHSTMPSVTCLRLTDVSVIYRVTYFQFPIQSDFLPYRSPGSTAACVVYPKRTSNDAANLGSKFLVRRVPLSGMIWNWF